jgi:hypothetical protein
LLLEAIEANAELPEGFATGLLIDGDRHGRAVLFDHDGHRQRLGGEASCGRCHHRNLRLDRGTPCTICHADMYRCTDIFDHQDHVEILGANSSCERCHKEPGGAKSRATSTPCLECHAADMVDCFTEERHPCVSDSRVGDTDCSGCHEFTPDAAAQGEAWHRARCGVAPGYRLAMHRLCIECHCAEESEIGAQEPYLSRCSCCHRGAGSEIDVQPDLIVSNRFADVRELIE